MVLFQKCVRWFGPSIKMAPTAELSLTSDPMGNSHRNLLLRNHWANCNQTFLEWSLDGSLPKLCPVIPTSNQDGRQTRRFLWEFSIGSYVKLSSAVAAILFGGLKWRTQIWKRTTQESFQQSLVEIGSVISEEKIFFKFHLLFFLICIIGQNRQKFKVHNKSRNIC
jgi:hypothetical protein